MKKKRGQWIGLAALALVILLTLLRGQLGIGIPVSNGEVTQSETQDIISEDAVKTAEPSDIAQDETRNITQTEEIDQESLSEVESGGVTEDGTYTSKEEVAAYIHQFGHLPSNYIRKNAAQDLGWDASKGNLWKVAPGMSIGGDRFGNREGLLPDAKGRKYTECDIDYSGGKRNGRRIVFSNDGLVFYTDDHYETFEQLY